MVGTICAWHSLRDTPCIIIRCIIIVLMYDACAIHYLPGVGIPVGEGSVWVGPLPHWATQVPHFVPTGRVNKLPCE